MSKSVFFHGAAPTTASDVVSASAATRTIDAAAAINPTAGAVNLSVWLVPSAGTAADANLMLAPLAVGAGATVTIPAMINQAIPAGATVQAAGLGVTLLISGRSQ